MARTPVEDLLNATITDLFTALTRDGGVTLAAEGVIRHIQVRTGLGRDKYLNRFTPYARSTRKRKKRKGQRQQPVSLKDTEQMLAGMDVRPIQRSWGTEVIESEIYFPDPRNAALARIHSDEESPRSKIPLRAFFGIEEMDEANSLITATMQRRIDTRLKKDRRTTVKITIFRMRGAV